MEFIDPELDKYVCAHSSAEPPLLYRLNRETHLKVLMPRMLSGHFQGRVLSMFSKMIQPSAILEIGTYTGYSALCLAEGLKKDGRLVTIDINAELETMVRRYFSESEFHHQIDYRIGNAIDVLPELNQQFDLVFIDADKENYCLYYDLVFDKIRPGGYIIADNVLWSGKVLLPDEKRDKDTRAILGFNTKVHEDPRVEHVLFPLRDGLMIARKK